MQEEIVHITSHLPVPDADMKELARQVEPSTQPAQRKPLGT